MATQLEIYIYVVSSINSERWGDENISQRVACDPWDGEDVYLDNIKE